MTALFLRDPLVALCGLLVDSNIYLSALRRHASASTVHLVLSLLHHMFLAHVHRVWQPFLSHWCTFDVGSQSLLTLDEFFHLLATAGVVSDPLRAHCRVRDGTQAVFSQFQQTFTYTRC